MTTYDERFDEAEAEVDRGQQWRPRDNPDQPNPLTVLAEEWVTVTTDFGEAELLIGRDREGARWSILTGPMQLQKVLVQGIVEEYDTEKNEFVVAATLGKVVPGEVVSIKDLGTREGGKYGSYRNFAISRKAARPEPDAPTDDHASGELPPHGDDDIPL